MKKRTLSWFIFLGAATLGLILTLQMVWFKKTIAIQETNIEIQNKEDSLNLVDFTESVHIALREVLDQIATQKRDSSDTYGAVQQIRNNRFVVDINEELQPFYLETLLKRAFYQNNVRQDFQYGIYDCFSDSIVYSNRIIFVPESETGFAIDSSTETATLSLNWKNDGHYFTVYFPKMQSGNSNVQSVKFTPWLYVFFIAFLVILLFWYSLAIILRQKKLSEIKNDFINNMTHEFKTPISTISLSAEMLLKPTVRADDDKWERYASIIYKENKRLENQVERVLNVAKLDKQQINLSLTNVDIHHLLEEVKQHFDLNREGKQGEIRLELNALHPVLMVDEVHISNVVYNLMDNAFKYAGTNPEITLRTYDQKQKLIIEVQDNGPGIKKEYHGAVFEKFFRVPTGNVHDVKGFGLGLYYVHSIISAHGGKIELKSLQDNGCNFVIQLPRNYSL